MLAKLKPLEAALSAEDEAAREAAALEARFGHLAPQDIIALSIGRFADAGIGAVSSFGSDSAVLLHMLARIDPGLEVIFLDTGKHFEETLNYRDALRADFGLSNIRVYEPSPGALAEHDPAGDLHRSSTDACCDIRKVEPMARAVAPRGSPAASGSRPPPAPRCRCSRRSARASASIPWRNGRRRTSPTTCAPISSGKIRWSPTAICRSAAFRAPSR